MSLEKNIVMKILISGTAGFIGFHLAKLLLKEGCRVHGYDGMTDYYDINLKRKDIVFYLKIQILVLQKEC